MKYLGVLATSLLFAALPATNNYRLNSYGFGSGGTANSHTTTYALEGSVGQASGRAASTGSGSSNTKPGYTETQQANVPKLISLDNNSGQYYDRLHFVIDPQNNPSDATYLIAVSTDNFAANTTYLQPDGTLSSTLSVSDYQTYSAWGGASGGLVIGLQPGTTYYVKLKATQGKFSESAYGPIVSQATANQSMTFNLATSSQSTPPYAIDIGNLDPGTVTTTSDSIDTSLSTNAASGASVYLNGKNGGLFSGSTGYKINTVSSDLSSVSEGYGAQNNSASQSAGATYAAVSPYSGSGSIIGLIDSTTRSLYSASGPVTNGTGHLKLKAKSKTTTLVAADYQDILTFTAAGSF